jgi:hypothetical protein
MWPHLLAMEWSSMLSWWQWGAMATIIPAIIALYFLKLKRLPLEVPSTYLWHKSIEDLHVNSLWQRLRQSILLLLQLLLLALLMLALARPSWQGSKLSGGRYIFLIDNSASMSATDVQPTRLHEAKRRVEQLIDEMQSGDEAMIISFADSAQVVQPYTDNRSELRRKLAEIKPTQRTTSLNEALRVASGLANPGQSGDRGNKYDAPVAEALPAKLYIFSDGRFPDVKDFSLGNLEPTYFPIGEETSSNVGIVAFNVSRNEEQIDRWQAFARLENHGREDAKLTVELFFNGDSIDADKVEIAPGESNGVAFDLGEIGTGALELRVGKSDDLAVDNRAWTVINSPRRAKVLFVTPGNEPLKFALRTDPAPELADLVIESPAVLKQPDYQKAASGSAYDLIIYDRCRPDEMPQANTLFIGQLPPGDAWKAEAKINVPQIIDSDRTHPLTQLVELSEVLVAEGTPLTPPPGGTLLIESNKGPLFVLAPREGFQDAVLGFELVSDGTLGTNWPLKQSFPVFVLNVLKYLGGAQEGQATMTVQPGRPVAWKSDTTAPKILVMTPGRTTLEIPRGRLNTFHINATEEPGLYEIREGTGPNDPVSGRFAVNLFSGAESNIPPRPEKGLEIGHTKVEAVSGWESARRDGWKFLLLAALAILLLEWYIYNRRVYL